MPAGQGNVSIRFDGQELAGLSRAWPEQWRQLVESVAPDRASAEVLSSTFQAVAAGDGGEGMKVETA